MGLVPCEKCGEHHRGKNEPCASWALRRHAFRHLVNECDSLADDYRLVFGAAQGLSPAEWARVVALAAADPDAIKKIAAGLRDYDTKVSP